MISVWVINCPLSVGGCIELMHNFISGTKFERELIRWKMQRVIYNDNLEVPLVDLKWWKLFKGRNPEIASKAGKKFARNDLCHETPF